MFFTGPAGVGKTTLVKKAVRRLGDRAGGFYLDEAPKGEAPHLRLVTLDGREGLLASRDLPSPVQVGPWHVDVDVLERLGVAAVRSAAEARRVVIVDEISPVSLAAGGLAQAVEEALSGAEPVLGTISPQAHPVLDAIRARQDTLVLDVTAANRDQLLERVWAGLKLPQESLADVQRRVDKQRERAARYAEQNRLSLSGISGQVRGDHGTYEVSWQGGQWHCSCSFFLKYATCAHTMAAEKSLQTWLPVTPRRSSTDPLNPWHRAV
ncbi:MAG: nucleoside-triphosphatase [Bacillota bacterium]